MVSTKALGPWNGGLKLTSNRDLSIFLKPNELGEATNVVYTNDGFIEPRPGVKKYLGDFGSYDSFTILGELKTIDNTISLIVQTLKKTGVDTQARVYRIDSKNLCSLVFVPPVNIKFSHIICYDSSAISNVYTGVFLFATEKNKCYYNTSMELMAPWQKIPDQYAVPGSDKGFIIKDRLFLFDYTNSVMWWSPANYILDFGLVDKASYGDDSYAKEPIESMGNQDYIRSVEFLNNNFYIFKVDRTYMFTYQVMPSEDGYLRKINDTMGAFSSTSFRNSIVVVNQKGIFKLDGTQFIDMQLNLDLRFEIPLDRNAITKDDIFITNFNSNVLFGLKVGSKYYHYIINAVTGGWSKWDFNYWSDKNPPYVQDFIATPGSRSYKVNTNTIESSSIFIFTSFDKKHLVYIDQKPDYQLYDYCLDSDTSSTISHTNLYIPSVNIKTSSSFGDSPITFLKLYRTFIRFYLSDLPRESNINETFWTLSINYNSYKFEYDRSIDGNPIFILHPANSDFDSQVDSFIMSPIPSADINSKVYTRTYQVPIRQQRIKEFVVELNRKPTSILSSNTIKNLDADRPIKAGYYFLLSSIWFDYQDKREI